MIGLHNSGKALFILCVAWLSACEQPPPQPVSNAGTAQNSDFSDPHIQCVLAVRKTRLSYSGKRSAYERRKENEYKYEVALSTLSDKNYPVLVKTDKRPEGGNPAVIYRFVISYKPCDDAKAFVQALHTKNYGEKTEFRDTSIDEYISIYRGN